MRGTLNAGAASTQTSPVVRRSRRLADGLAPGRRARPLQTQASAAPTPPLSCDYRPTCLHPSCCLQIHPCSTSLLAPLAFDGKADLCVCQKLPLRESRDVCHAAVIGGNNGFKVTFLLLGFSAVSIVFGADRSSSARWLPRAVPEKRHEKVKALQPVRPHGLPYTQ